MEIIKMTPMTLYAGQQRRQRCKNGVLDSVREGEDGMIGENAIEICPLPYIK